MTKNAFILNFFRLYNILWKLALPFLKKNNRLKQGFAKMITSDHLKKADIWIQAASAGEAYLAVSLIKALAPRQQLKILVTTLTSQGLDILHTHLTDAVIHENINLAINLFPFDMPDIMARTVKKVDPGVMVLLETEIWPALLWNLKQRKTKIFIVNARLSTKSFSLYKKTRFLWKYLAPDMILATSKRDAKLYKQIFDASNVKTMPNIKFESIQKDELDTKIQQAINQVLPENIPITLLASVRKKEEEQICSILDTILKSYPNQVVAIFPRHMHRVDPLKKLLEKQGMQVSLRSRITTPVKEPKVILWDTFGELKTAYESAQVVFVGGSLAPLGGQNFIEPAITGAITITGPYYDDFAWVGDKIFKDKIVIKKDDQKGVSQSILIALENLEKQKKSELRQKACKYVNARQGGTLQSCKEILKAFDG